jgi:ABC-type antimicrobial peptide transport system permease subunit
LASMLYHVRVRDLPTFVLASTLFLLVGVAASYLPARRALSVDPKEALRGN